MINEEIKEKESIIRASRVMPNGDSEGWIFLSYPHTHDRFFIYNIALQCAYDCLTRCMLGDFSCFLLSSADFFQIHFFIFQEHYQSCQTVTI